MRVYISGPMSNMKDLNFEAFCQAENALRAKGHDPIKPHDIKSEHDTWESHMKADIAVMLACDAVCFLQGWENSRGCLVEVPLAKALGMPTFSIDAL